MSRILYLLRHAQSADKQPGSSDKSRDLTAKGVRDAVQIGNYLFQHKYFPEQIISSTAARAHQTAELVTDAMKFSSSVTLEDELYTASVRSFFAIITGIDDHVQSVMCIGHNPTISYLAEYLTKAEIGDLPPAGLVIIRFSTRWKEIMEGCGEFVGVTTPKTLS
jgi:phosphohistidine phosphatase